MKTVENQNKHFDVEKLLKAKGGGKIKFIPKFALNWLKRIIHENEINDFLVEAKDLPGVDFCNQILKTLDITVESIGMEHLQKDQRYLFASNHPLGGVDGMILISEIYPIRGKVIFPVNQILLAIPNCKELFIPIDKHGSNFENLKLFKEAFNSEANILYFPAGLCSRRVHGEIIDLDWKKTFLTQAIQSNRDIVPVFFGGQNSRFFYSLANFRKFFKIKFNIEMCFLIDEMFKQKGNTIKIFLGKPIPIKTFDKRYTEKEWADLIKDHVYKLSKNPNLTFPY